MRRASAALLATAAFLLFQPTARGGPAEDCLGAPTVACITEHFAEGADLPLRVVPPEARDDAIARLIGVLLALGRVDEAERVARRDERGRYPPDRSPSFAEARFAASVRAGAPEFGLLDGLASPEAPLASDRDRLAWAAYWKAGYALLGRFAADAGVAEARDAPAEARAAFRASPAWRGLADGLAKWNERVPPVHRPQGWTILAEFQFDLGDLAATRDALERIGPVPADNDEVELWWRLGEPVRADARARGAKDSFVLRRHLERVAREALARGDRAGALAALDDAWAKGVVRDEGRRPLDVRHLRRVVRLTAEAGDRTMAVARAEAIRDLPASGTLVPEEPWVDSAAALNDIGAHEDASRVLRDLLALRPADLAAAGLGAGAPVPRGAERPGRAPRVRAAAELFRAGLPEAAARLLRATLPPGPEPAPRTTRRADVEALAALFGLSVPPEAAERIARAEGLSARARWRFRGSPDSAIEWSEVVRNDAAHPERVAGLLALIAGAPAQARIYVLLGTAREDAAHGRPDAATVRLVEAVILLAGSDQPYSGLCDAMSQAARLGRGNVADAAFRAAVAAARTEPDAVRAAILLDAAACRAVPRH